MQITPNVLSIPPYVSTTWENIISLRTTANTLIISLRNGEPVAIPEMDESDITTLFEAHASYTQKNKAPNQSQDLSSEISLPFMMNIPLSGNDNSHQSLGEMHQNPTQGDIPPEILKRIAMVAKAFGLDEVAAIAPQIPDCNCVYCQISRFEELSEEIISDEDLKFRDWEINQTGDNVYSVINPVDQEEHYSVFLGNPLGCTCGKNRCEHIKAVLQS